MRKMSAHERFLRNGLWVSRGAYNLGSKIGGKRVGIVGLGQIGLEVAKRLEAFGCKILYTSRKEKPAVSYRFYPELSELAADSDVLVVCGGLTAQTHHMIDKKVLFALGREGVTTNNAGRGAVIYEKEIVRCLVQGEIKGAGLDAFEKEPEVPKELLRLDKMLYCRHIELCTQQIVLQI